MHFTSGLMVRISLSRAGSSSTVLSGFVITTPNDRTHSRCRVSACPAESNGEICGRKCAADLSAHGLRTRPVLDSGSVLIRLLTADPGSSEHLGFPILAFLRNRQVQPNPPTADL